MIETEYYKDPESIEEIGFLLSSIKRSNFNVIFKACKEMVSIDTVCLNCFSEFEAHPHGISREFFKEYILSEFFTHMTKFEILKLMDNDYFEVMIYTPLYQNL